MSDQHAEAALPLRAATTQARSLLNEIAEISTRLNGLLKNESEDRRERAKALQFLNSVSDGGGGTAEQDHLESSIARLVDGANAAVERLDKQCKIMISNQRGIQEKIRKKTIDIERTTKRLESLRHIRPAYMDEYEQLEEELQVEYESYVVRLRNVDYLEGELAFFEQAATERQKKAERSMKRMQKKVREEELRILNGGDDYHEPDVGNASREITDNAALDSRIDASSPTSSSTPRERTSFSRSEGSPSAPSSTGSGHSFDGSETTGSLIDDDDDSDDHF